MNLKTLVGLLLGALLGFLGSVALGQSEGPRSGPVSWTYSLDGGPSDGGWVDGGTFDAGILYKQLPYACVDGGFYNYQGPWTCASTWIDGGYVPSEGAWIDGGWADAGCTDAGIVGDGGWQDGGLYDAGQYDAGITYECCKDGGFAAGPDVYITFSNYTWLPISVALDAGPLYANPINFAGFTGAGAIHAVFDGMTGAGALVGGTLCLLEGYPAPANSWEDAGCQTLDGGFGPFTWDVGPVYTPSLEFYYNAGVNSDGGFLVGTYTITNY